MSLSVKYDELYEKLNILCDTNDLKFEFNKEIYPITVTLTLLKNVQINLFEAKSEENEKKKNVVIKFDEIPTIKSDFEIEKGLLDKIVKLSEKLYICYLELFFKKTIIQSQHKNETNAV